MSQKDFAIKQALKGKTPTQIHQILVDMFESDALPLSTYIVDVRDGYNFCKKLISTITHFFVATRLLESDFIRKS